MMSSTLVTIKGKSKVNLEGEEGSRQEKNCFLILWMILPKSETSPSPPPQGENGCLGCISCCISKLPGDARLSSPCLRLSKHGPVCQNLSRIEIKGLVH